MGQTDSVVIVLKHELQCVERQIVGCDRNCIKCDLCLPDEIVINAYKNAIQKLSFDDKLQYQYGQWIKHPTYKYKICSICGQGSPCDVDGSEWLTRYCPNCGKKMKMEDANNGEAR